MVLAKPSLSSRQTVTEESGAMESSSVVTRRPLFGQGGMEEGEKRCTEGREEDCMEGRKEDCTEDREKDCTEDREGAWSTTPTAGESSQSATILATLTNKPTTSPVNKRKGEREGREGREESNSPVSSSPTSTLLNKRRRKGVDEGGVELEENCSLHRGDSLVGDDESYKPVTPEGLEQMASISDVIGSSGVSELHSLEGIGNGSACSLVVKKQRSTIVRCSIQKEFPVKDGKTLLGLQDSSQEAKVVSKSKEVLCQTNVKGRKRKSDQMASRAKSLITAVKAFEEAKRTKPFWQELNVSGVDHRALIGRACEVYWPLDDLWYPAVVQGYNPVTGKHKVLYEDECEWLLLSSERIKLLLPPGERLHSTCTTTSLMEQMKCTNSLKDDESCSGQPVGLNKQSDIHQSSSPGDVVWGKVKGYPEWPAILLDEEHALASGLEEVGGQSHSKVALQYFGTFDKCLQSRKSCRLFEKGVEALLHSKSQKSAFLQALDQVERYLTERVLPPAMASSMECLSSNSDVEDEDNLEGEENRITEKKSIEQPQMPLILGSLTVLSLGKYKGRWAGKVVTDSEHFHSDKYIWPEGYMAVRMFPSSKDVTKLVEHHMEVLRKAGGKGTVFRVTPADGKAVDGDTPGMCWSILQRRVIQAKERLLQTDCGIPVDDLPSHAIKKGPAEFGFSSQQIASMIQALPNAHTCSKFQAWQKPPVQKVTVPAGYIPQHYTWQHGDRCSVCYTHEEYEDNQLLQCDKCRMMVHMDCYGVDERPDGDLWLCDVCDTYLPKDVPPCCLCPVQGGAMKRTSDGRWAHVTCAIWIPETTFEGLKVIRGIAAINKARWKLLCSICRVPYGACIQCVAKGCCVAYHPLCARKEGLSMELTELNVEDEHFKSRVFVGSVYANLQLLSFCRRHKKVTNSPSPGKHLEFPALTKVNISELSVEEDVAWQPAVNPSGSARSEPYNAAVRRGRREPDALAAAMAKRNFVENVPYIISGCREANLSSRDKMPFVDVARSTWAMHWKTKKFGRHLEKKESDPAEPPADPVESGDVDDGRACLGREESGNSGGGTAGDEAVGSGGLMSMSDRFRKMQGSLHSRLAFGKSAIHGWGLFAKVKHKAGDMMIEYAGEIVRPIIADIRERRCYDSLVGAGTYMFRIDAERVVDATRRGSMAHLINHACEPNCYSRVVKAGKEDHIVIFAKRDIMQGEELTYDYRFNSRDEMLPCNCGSRGCRGVVNIHDDDDSLMAKRSELTPWDMLGQAT